MAEIDALIAKVNKKLQTEVLVRGSQLARLTFERVTTGSLAFDIMLGGGWPLNCWSEIVGNESHGKTVMALKTIAANQERNPDYETLWIASEDFNVDWAQALGVDLGRITLARTNAMEDAYDIIIQMLDARTVDAVILDSYPALQPQQEWDNTMEEWVIGLGARLTNKFMRKSGTAQRRSLTEEDRPCLGIIINQWRDKIGTFMGDPRTTPGGRGKNFHYFTRVEVTRDSWIERGNEKVGQVIKARTIKNKTAPPQRIGQVDFYFKEDKPFSQGDYDTVKEMVSIAMFYDIIERHGSVYSFGTDKWRGQAEVLEQVRQDLDLQDTLTAQVRQVALHLITPASEITPKRRQVKRKK